VHNNLHIDTRHPIYYEFKSFTNLIQNINMIFTSHIETENIIKSFNGSNAFGDNVIPNKILKACAKTISSSLAYVCVIDP